MARRSGAAETLVEQARVPLAVGCLVRGGGCPAWGAALPRAAHRFFSDEKRILYANGSVEFYSTYPGMYDP
jgi:hypothetical protein